MLSVLPAPTDLAALEGRLLWRAGRMAEPPALAAATGWAALDAELPGGGWPVAGMTELLIEPAGGELALLAPWLGRGREPLLWIAPPGWPCVAALRSPGPAVERLVCVDPARAADSAWAAEQGLRAGCCAAVLDRTERDRGRTRPHIGTLPHRPGRFKRPDPPGRPASRATERGRPPPVFRSTRNASP